MTKIDIFSGFLGAGKTTLIKKLIAEAYQGEKLVLIENEFGEIGVDSGFLKDSGINITEMSQGCICCSLVGDFGKALNKVIEEYNPERILIEPSGVGKLSDVIRAVVDLNNPDITLNSFTTCVDANKCKMYAKNFGEFFNDQIMCANCIVLSRTKDISEEKLLNAINIVRDQNEDATIITTPWDEISGKTILEAMEHKSTLALEIEKLSEEDDDEDEECSCGHHHHHHHDDDEECSCGHHHHHDDDDEDDDDCCCGHHHHDEDEDDDDDCCCGHHHHDEDDDDDDDCCCGHHHDEEEHHHHHHHDDEEECSCGHHHHHHDEEEECSCGHHHHHHHGHDADEVFMSWGKESPKKFQKEDIEKILEELDGGEYGLVVRAKGIVPSTDGKWIHFDYVPAEYNVRYGSAEVIGRICVIGSKLKEKGLEELFGV